MGNLRKIIRRNLFGLSFLVTMNYCVVIMFTALAPIVMMSITKKPSLIGLPIAIIHIFAAIAAYPAGRLMDRVMSSVNPRDRSLEKYAERELKPLVPHCNWTRGRWRGLDDLSWNELQNVPRHVRLLSSHLIRTYVHQGHARK